MAQLHMVRDFERFPCGKVFLPAGFVLERRGPEDVAEYLELREKTGWGKLPSEDFLTAQVLEKGLIFCREVKTGEVAASATGERSCFGSCYGHIGTLGQVMCQESYRGLHLGTSVCLEAAAAVAENGYRYIGLLTDDFRTSALFLYLKHGWRPWMIDEEMPERWKTIYSKLNIDIDPEECYPRNYFDIE